jgi:hypothetical protein
LKACLDTKTAWSCAKYKTAKEEPKVYSTAEEFEKAE